MKNTFLLLCIVAASCCGTKKSLDTSAGNAAPGMETTKTEKEKVTAENVPACLLEMISGFTKEEKQNPPRKIYSYTYKGKTVYYVTPPCCDFFSDLYDSDCKLMGHPDGGITGRGDGKFPDFEKEKSNEKIVWKDKRK